MLHKKIVQIAVADSHSGRYFSYGETSVNVSFHVFFGLLHMLIAGDLLGGLMAGKQQIKVSQGLSLGQMPWSHHNVVGQIDQLQFKSPIVKNSIFVGGDILLANR